MKRWAVWALIHLYPARWRSEYGAELEDVLLRRPLGLRELLNVAANALWQQCRDGEPWLVLGVPLALLSLVGCIEVVCGMPFAARPRGVKVASSIDQLLLLLATGYWTMERRGRAAGRAAIKLNLLVCAPLALLGLCAMAGLFQIKTVDNGASASYWRWLLVIAPVMQIPYAGAVGLLGGGAARVVRRLRRQTTA
jgi:hypothetical protein